ncbi:MAG: hypothetical protein KDH17_04205 [Rhodocyclaceae bacterium]|nr:hypothetical protein [Rhodocyclaceae bacterium]
MLATNAGGKTLAFQYDPAGNRTRTCCQTNSWATGAVVSCRHSSTGR